MAKEKKLWKLVEDRIKIIECMKDCLNEYSLKSNLIKSIVFKGETFNDSIRIVASLDCGSFEQRIVYYPKMLGRAHFIDTEFSFENSDYVYNFYDIFNLFDIDDFELYCYDILLLVDDVENALKEILAQRKNIFTILKRRRQENICLSLRKTMKLI